MIFSLLEVIRDLFFQNTSSIAKHDHVFTKNTNKNRFLKIIKGNTLPIVQFRQGEYAMMNATFINNENAGTVMAWCAVGTFVLGAGMAIYQIYSQKKQQDAMEEAKNAFRGIPNGNAQQLSKA